MMPLDQTHLYVSVGTDPGRKGKNNEDRYGVSAFQLSDSDLTPSLLAVVADGVGGHRAGEVAAEMAVEIISQVISVSDGKDPQITLAEAIQQANQAITARANSNKKYRGMGTTCACVWIIGDRLYTVALGDSRIYLIRNDEIKQISVDHTWVQEALEAGILTPEQARNHPNAHVIRRYLGSQLSIVPDFRIRLEPTETVAESESNQGMRLFNDDLVLLCSDGLTDLVSDDEILEVLSVEQGQEGINQLLALANSHGGYDNITAITLQVPPMGPEYLRARQRRRSLFLWGVAIVMAVVIILGIILGGYYWLEGRVDSGLIPTDNITHEISPKESTEQYLSLTNDLDLENTLTPFITTITSPTPEITQSRATYTPWPTSTLVPTEVER